MARQCGVCGKSAQIGNRVTTRGKQKYLGGVGTKVTGISRRTFKPNLQRVNVSTANGITTSTTKLAFDAPTPASGWAFALGDIDADQVEISGTDTAGHPLTAADLGFAGVFNYCAVSPKPGGCTGPGPFTDVPTWHPGSARLVGNGPDTFGASGWFVPAMAAWLPLMIFAPIAAAASDTLRQ